MPMPWICPKCLKQFELERPPANLQTPIECPHCHATFGPLDALNTAGPGLGSFREAPRLTPIGKLPTAPPAKEPEPAQTPPQVEQLRAGGAGGSTRLGRLFGPPNAARLKARGDVQGLVDALDSRWDWPVRRAAAVALGELGDPRAVEALLAILNEIGSTTEAIREEWAAKTAVSEALLKLADARAVRAFIGGLGSEWTRQVAGEALAKIGPAAVPALILNFQAGQEHLRLAIANTLGRIGDPRAIAPLIQTLHDPGIGYSIARALGLMGRRAVPALLPILRSQDRNARRNAAYALKDAGWQPDRSEQGAAYWIATGEYERCTEVGPAAIPLLVPLLWREKRLERRKAAQALAGLKWTPANGEQEAWYYYALQAWDRLVGLGAVATNPILAGLKLDDPDPEFDSQAVHTLGEIQDSRAVEPLFALLAATMRQNPELYERLREAVLEAIGHIGDRRHAAALLDHLFAFPKVSTMHGGRDRVVTEYVRAFEPMFADYTALVLESAGYLPYSYGYPLSQCEEAVRRLTQIDTAVASNLLHKVAERRDLNAVRNVDDYGRLHTDTVSLQALRDRAGEELARRGNPPYDPAAYQAEGAWQLGTTAPTSSSST
jgi:HEAT repeat protein